MDRGPPTQSPGPCEPKYIPQDTPPSLTICCLFCLALAGLGLHCCAEALSLQQAERRLGGCAQLGLRHAGSSWPRDRTRVSCIEPSPASAQGSLPPSTAMVSVKLGPANFSSCPNGSSQWIWDVLGECAQDGWDKASVGLGLLSILCFAASTFPQYIKACKTGNMDQALSVWFLLGWIGGDSCNLIGSFLADQLPLQTYTAVYYVLADVLMLSLYFYYKFKKRPSPWSARINSLLLFILGVACTTPLLRSARSGAAPREVFRGRTLLSVEPGNKVRCRHERVEWGWGSGVATWLGGSLPRRELGALALHPWPLRGTEQPPHPLSPSRKRRSLASPSAPCPACCTCSPGCLRSAPTSCGSRPRGSRTHCSLW
uniref:Solute carrier family 66 member 1 n=1 Tax=Ovis aries TaxID=9940 RepID=A0AC11CXL8_SHEEP